MKKAISLLLSVLMIVSMFSIACVQVSAAEVQEYFTVANTGFSNDEITYYISLNPNQNKINSAILNFSFDSNVLKVVEEKSGAVGENNNYGEFDANVDGLYEKGLNKTSGKYVVAFFNPNGTSVGASSVAFVKITFEVISDERPLTSVGFECVEFISDDGVDNDKTKKTDPVVFAEDSFLTLNAAKNKEVLSNKDGLKFVWESVAGAEWYKIYRKAEDETEWSVIAEQVLAPETNYVDKISGDDLGKVFEYVAEPYNSYGSVPHSETGVKGLYFGTIDFIDAVMTETGATVSWTLLDKAESYSLYQMAEGDEAWTFVASVTAPEEATEISCASKPLESGKKYFFTVKAHKGDYLAETSADPAELVFLGAPDDVYTAISDEAITLSWSEVRNAESYNVYKRSTDEEAFALLCDVTDGVDGVFEFEDTAVVNGEIYEYAIQSVNSDTESVMGANSVKVRKLPVTKNVTTELKGNGVLVSWDAADFADGYKVFKKESDTTGWTAIGTSQTTEFLDTRVSTGKTYSYKVATYSDGGMYEAENSESSEEILYIALPTVTGAVAYGDRITISWKKLTGAECYDVFKYDSENEQWEYVDSVDVNTYDDYDIVGGETYGYSVVAVVGDKTSVFDENGVWVKYLSAPTGLSAENASNGVKLSWNQVAGAEEYVIYHKVGTGAYQEIARFDADETTYVHTAATTGQDNYYSVYAVGGLTYSEAAEISFRYLSAPSITSVTYVNRNRSILVAWGKVTGADSYNVYRKACNSTEWELIGTTSTNSYSDPDVFYTNDYTYTVQACYGDSCSAYDNEGKSYSLQISGTPTLQHISGDRWRCKVGSAYNSMYKGLVYYSGAYYYVADGYVDWDYNGVVYYNNEEYYVSNGFVDMNGVTLIMIDGEWYCVENGKLSDEYTGLVQYAGNWYYVIDGYLDWSVTTLVDYNGSRYYVENGSVNWGTTTLYNYDGDWYYIENGAVKTSYTGLVQYNGIWYHVVSGYLDWEVTTLTNYNGTWYYVEKGQINWNSNTLCEYGGNWYYVQNGSVNWNYTGLVPYGGNWYYVVNGFLDWNISTLTNYNGVWYYVVNGFLDWNVTTLTNYNGVWYYVENGQVNWNSDTLCQYQGGWYYVKNGAVAWDYTGYVIYYGTNYYIIKGFLDWSKQ